MQITDRSWTQFDTQQGISALYATEGNPRNCSCKKDGLGGMLMRYHRKA